MIRTALSDDLTRKGTRALARVDLRIPDDALRDAALRVFALSDFAASVALRQREWLQRALATHGFERPLNAEDLSSALAAFTQVDAMPALQKSLRIIRQRHQLWIVWRHLSGQARLEETTSACSLMADRLIDAALAQVYAWLCERRGTPLGERSKSAQSMVVLALGKLGAHELNLSSDVDLLFAYPEQGKTSGRETNQQFFVRLGQELIQALDATTEDGFVCRVDMRLRPFGASGPLAMAFSTIEDYYAAQGRDWERYALIKARPCAGDIVAGERLLESLRPFVYRRYLDFGAIDALREMKSRLLTERHQREDVKLGPGGIRDVEFIVQMQQMIWGGREPRLRNTRLLEVIPQLLALGRLDVTQADALSGAYRFLRDTEHSLQAEADRQTHHLPTTVESRERLAQGRGYPSFAEFLSVLDEHRKRVAELFEDLIAPAPLADSSSHRLWAAPSEKSALADFGFIDIEASAALLVGLHKARDRPSVSADARKRLDRLLPALLDRIRSMPDPDLSLRRVTPIIKSVLRRSAYLALLAENPVICGHFVDLTTMSGWLAENLADHPAFFDSLIDERALGALTERDELLQAVEGQLNRVDDPERALDILREFKSHHVFNVALAEIRGTLSLMRVSDALTFLAEAMLGVALDMAWRETAERFPQFAATRPFIIVGYGKLGGVELGPGSDLDIVFIHAMPDAAFQFRHRLVRRLLHVLTARTYHGALYAIDTRLRPSGNAGTMVSSLEAFRDYQLNRAWVWEHQALVRARAVCGDPALTEGFARVRAEILCQPRDRKILREEIVKMRQRLSEHHDQEDDLKRGSGGIVDIEFMVQYLVLAWASENPALIEYTDNVRILEAVDRLGLLPTGVAAKLTSAYLALRAQWHRSVLDISEQAGVIENHGRADLLGHHRDDVRTIWRLVFREEE